jgi:hypothetical protein
LDCSGRVGGDDGIKGAVQQGAVPRFLFLQLVFLFPDLGDIGENRNCLGDIALL